MRTVVALLVVFALSAAMAQTFTVLKSFSAIDINSGTNWDGARPYAGLTLVDGLLYGTTAKGGSSSNGTVFVLNPDGTDFRVLVGFNGSNGRECYSGLTFLDGQLYGTTFYGGKWDAGTVFRMQTNGPDYSILKDFVLMPGVPTEDGFFPNSSPVVCGNALFGATEFGGTNGTGTLFRINMDGTGYGVLINFPMLVGSPGTNSDGAYPAAELTLSNSTLYGIAYHGGSFGAGTVFKLSTNGTGYSVIKTFLRGSGSDGANPFGKLVLSGGILYGTTLEGGSSGLGTVFKMDANGAGYTVLKSFTGPDGVYPFAGLTLVDEKLYGATCFGGSADNGAVFEVNTDGTGFRVLKNFTSIVDGINTDGANPYGELVVSDNALFGTTSGGGMAGNGTIFKLPIQPTLSIQLVGDRVVLSWPGNGLALQTAPIVNGAYTNIPGATSPHTNPVVGAERYFRLKAN